MASYQSRSKHTIKGHMAYFISDEDTKKGKDSSIYITNGIHNIKGKTYVNVLSQTTATNPSPSTKGNCQ